MNMKETKEQQRERTDSKIMHATLEIIIAQGIGAVNIESVARRSGVAKTTIYRRYANTDDLIRHLTLTVAPSLDFSVLEPSRESLHTVLRRIIDCFDEEFELKAIGVVLSSENAHLRNIAKSVIEPAAERFYDFLRRGMASGAFLVRGPARRLGGQHDGVVVGVHPACAIIHRRLSGFSTVLPRQRWLY